MKKNGKSDQEETLIFSLKNKSTTQITLQKETKASGSFPVRRPKCS